MKKISLIYILFIPISLIMSSFLLGAPPSVYFGKNRRPYKDIYPDKKKESAYTSALIKNPGLPGKGPVIIWYESLASLKFARRWTSIPEDLRKRSVLQFFLPNDFKKRPEFFAAMDLAKEYNIPLSLCYFYHSGRYAEQYIDVLPPLADVEELIKNYPNIKMLHMPEIACWNYSAADNKIFPPFLEMCARNNILFRPSLHLSHKHSILNTFVTNKKLCRLLKKYGRHYSPNLKTVNGNDLAQQWAESAGLWLTGITAAWGLEYDVYYWRNRTSRMRGKEREQFWINLHDGNMWQSSAFAREANPPWVLKDIMILSALTGCKYFSHEVWGGFGPGEELRKVFENTCRTIIRLDLVKRRNKMLKLTPLAVQTTKNSQDAFRLGYRYGRGNNKLSNRESPNILWKEVFGMPSGSFRMIPVKGEHYLVPVVPPGFRETFNNVLLPHEIAARRPLVDELRKIKRNRFTADDQRILVFDAGDNIYITQNNEDRRETIEFTLSARVNEDYSCKPISWTGKLYNKLDFVKRKTKRGWCRRILLYPGQSIVMTKSDGRSALPQADPALLKKGLVAYWPLDEEKNGFFSDLSGSGLTAGAEGAYRIVKGKINRAVSFDGRSALLTVPHSEKLSLKKSLSFSFWLKCQQNTAQWSYIIKKYAGNHRNYGLYINPRRGAIDFSSTHAGSSTKYSTIATRLKPDINAWTHFAIAADFEKRALYLYKNGRKVDHKRLMGGRFVTNTEPLRVGDTFRGCIDEMRIYNRVLTAPEIRLLYSGERKPHK